MTKVVNPDDYKKKAPYTFSRRSHFESFDQVSQYVNDIFTRRRNRFEIDLLDIDCHKLIVDEFRTDKSPLRLKK